ncbi:MAG: hypothetical protein S4CHLAM102_02520 [Chlamydiia bacterium]|nr:hypothetical protein [Chlamydiia bacterium]
MKSPRILICGAGPAGLASAYWLDQAGFNVELIEKRPRDNVEGYLLILHGEGLEMLHQMGIYEAACAQQANIQQIKHVNDRGRIITQINPSTCEFGKLKQLVITRDVLCEILAEQVKHIPCRFNEQVTDLVEDETGVRVAFLSGRTDHFDLVIGADGIHSMTRKLIWNREEDFWYPFDLCFAFFKVPNFMGEHGVEYRYQAFQRALTLYYPSEGDGRAAIFFPGAPDPAILRDDQLRKQFAQAPFANDGWEVKRVLDYFGQYENQYFDCVANIRMPTWSKGRVCLVGDSGYASSPLGAHATSVAFVGGYILANALTQSADYRQAFLAYEEKMRPFVFEVQQRSEKIANRWKSKYLSWFDRRFDPLAPISRGVWKRKEIGVKDLL